MLFVIQGNGNILEKFIECILSKKTLRSLYYDFNYSNDNNILLCISIIIYIMCTYIYIHVYIPVCMYACVHA